MLSGRESYEKSLVFVDSLLNLLFAVLYYRLGESLFKNMAKVLLKGNQAVARVLIYFTKMQIKFRS